MMTRLDQLEAMATWKEAIHGRIEAARVRLNLGLPDNDSQLADEVAEFKAECRRICGRLREAGQRRAA